MNNSLVPKQPEKMIIARISLREAHLLKVLRKYEFGKIIVHKMNGILVRAELNESLLIKEDEAGLDLEEKDIANTSKVDV